MKYICFLLVFLCCFLKTHDSVAQTDTMYNINEIMVMVIENNQKNLIVYDTSSYMESMSSIIYYHYDSLNRPIKDSAIYDKRRITKYYHYVDGETELKYTYYHEDDINISYTETTNDSIAIFNIIRFKNNDTVFQRDTIFLYYPDLGAIYYYDNNITLEALGEKVYSPNTLDNKLRVFMVKGNSDTTFFVVLYTISDILKESLLITKKTGNYLHHSFFKSKEDMIKNYVYESSNKIVSNKKMRKILQEMTTLEYLPIDEIGEDLIVEYKINGKYYLLTFSDIDLPIYADFTPEMLKTYKVVKKLISYLEKYSR